MRPRRKPEPGDILCIPLQEDLVGAAIVLHVSQRIKRGMLVGLYDRGFRSLEQFRIDDLRDAHFIATPNYTGTQMVSDGTWPVVGNSQELLELVTVPELRVVASVYYKDTIVRAMVPREEWGNYTELSVAGGQAVQNMLRKHLLERNPDFVASRLVDLGSSGSELAAETTDGAEEDRLEQQVTVHVRLSDDRFGQGAEREDLWTLEDQLYAALEERGVGRHVAVETGEGFITHYLEGESADEIFNAVYPVAARFPLPPGSYIVKRYGDQGDREEKVTLPGHERPR